MSNTGEQLKSKTKKIGPTILLSSFFVAIGYVLLIIPFAFYSLAQISAMIGKQYSLYIMVLVFVVLLFFSVLLGSPLLFVSALLLLISMPFFLIAITLREKFFPKAMAFIILLMPLCVGFYSLIFIPVLNNNQFNQVLTQIENSISAKKQDVQKQIETNVSASPETQLISKYDEAIAQIQLLSSLKELREYVSYNPWQRMAWFVVNEGSLFFFFAILISFANIIFLDLAFEQVEKIKAIITYVFKNASSFSYEFVVALAQLPISITNKEVNSTFSILKHDPSAVVQPTSPHIKMIRLSLFKNPNQKNQIFLRGYAFTSEGHLRTWNLKKFSLPLPFVLLSLAFMASILFWYGSAQGLIQALATNHYSPFIALGCMLSFAFLAILTLQGLFTFYMRVSNLVSLLVLFSIFLFASTFSIGYYAIIAIFGSIALLDYVYDWRRKNIR